MNRLMASMSARTTESKLPSLVARVRASAVFEAGKLV
jgi:hypothetical protein